MEALGLGVPRRAGGLEHLPQQHPGNCLGRRSESVSRSRRSGEVDIISPYEPFVCPPALLAYTLGQLTTGLSLRAVRPTVFAPSTTPGVSVDAVSYLIVGA